MSPAATSPPAKLSVVPPNVRVELGPHGVAGSIPLGARPGRTASRLSSTKIEVASSVRSEFDPHVCLRISYNQVIDRRSQEQNGGADERHNVPR